MYIFIGIRILCHYMSMTSPKRFKKNRKKILGGALTTCPKTNIFGVIELIARTILSPY